MARTKGARNEGFEDKRTALIAALRARLRASGPAPSMRELAVAADVTVPTLKHYFPGGTDADGRTMTDREAIVRAVMEDELVSGSAVDGPLEIAATPSGPFARSVRDLLQHADEGFRYGGLTDSHAMGLAEGARSLVNAVDYLRLALDPTIDAFAERLRAYQTKGEMRADADPRAAAVQLLAPLVVARLHQDRFGGREANPIDMDAMLDQQAEAFVRGYAA